MDGPKTSKGAETRRKGPRALGPPSPPRGRRDRVSLREPLVRVRLTLPDDVDGPRELAEFDISVEEAMSIFLDRKVVLARSGRDTPTSRLKRAIAEAETITEGRFENADDLFDALSTRR